VDDAKQTKFSKELTDISKLMGTLEELEKNPSTEQSLKEALSSLIEAAKAQMLAKYSMINSLLLNMQEGVLPKEVSEEEY
jgi:hypothetical protein